MPQRFVPGTKIRVPGTPKARFAANIAALEILAVLDQANRQATAAEQEVLAGWSSWGALPEVFDPDKENWATEREQVRGLLTGQEWDAARATTLNAHYTDPAIAHTMWAALTEAGFTGGAVIEPGCGVGTFIGQAPADAQMIGVELDPVTARIASYLYPEATIHGYGYERLSMPEGVASAAIGNVPFGNFRIHDPRHNSAKLNIHNHFILKSLRMVAPGGYVAVVTSSYTMDSATSTARREIAKYGDLVSAARLPNTAFKEVAGTDVLADVLVFRRREPDAVVDEKRVSAWVETTSAEFEGTKLEVNRWFVENPSAILGTASVSTNQFGSEIMQVRAEKPVSEALGHRMIEDIQLAKETGLGFAPVPVVLPGELRTDLLAPGLRTEPANADAVIGQVRLTKDRNALEAFGVDGMWEPVKIAKKVAAAALGEYRDLIGIKETARKVIDAQRAGSLDLPERERLRASLLGQYQGYVGKYGPVNRFTLKAGNKPSQKKIDSDLKRLETSWRRDLDEALSASECRGALVPEEVREQWLETILDVEDVRVQEHTVALRRDPDFGLLMAVENFDEETGEARPADICLVDILGASVSERVATNAADALAIALDEGREIDLERVGALLDVDAEEAKVKLGDLVFTDPRTGQIVPSVHYLSGDVLTKLDVARDAVSVGQLHFEVNVHALEAVKRRPVQHYEINTKPGGYWVEPEDYARFCLEVFQASVNVETNPLSNTWALGGPAMSKFAPDVQFRFGVGRKKSPLWVLEQVMNNRSLKVMKKIEVQGPGGDWVEKTVEDTKATAVARAKGMAVTEAFATWLYQDESRRDRVVDRYNRMFNSYVAPDYTSLSEHMTLPGIADKFVPHHYQREAVARIVNEPTVLLDHVVGAGKTGTMVMGAMELRRTGIARKPWIVVPNHLVDQISREFKEWYPASSILAMPTGADEETRRRYVAASATGDWDAVIVPFSTFEKIAVDPVKTRVWLAEEIGKLQEELRAKKNSEEGKKSRITIKTVEAAIKKLEARFEAIVSNKDAGLTFEDSGCDYLFVDEAHSFKNLRRSSDFQELAHQGSNRASDIDFKLRSLRESKLELAIAEGRDVVDYLPAVATFATGTPVANSLAELWVMQHYLRPDLLDKAGLHTVDAWGNQFTKSATKIELSPSGGEYKARERLSKFVNVPELLALTNQFTSAVTINDITAKLPALAGGKRTPMVREASEHVVEYVDELAERAENLPADPSVDNLLKITNDGRSVALDPRLVGLDADPNGGRVTQVAEQILRIHANTNHLAYTSAFGEQEPLEGGLQLVFADRAIPNTSGRFSIYDAITEELVAGGIDRDDIAFIHDAVTDADKAALFERCRKGQVRVLFGSTERMGTGTNVQKRAVALHHVDIPWRPADLEQREGRIIRQGNQNSEIEILNYLTEGTFDVYMWQTVTRKAEFIAQVKHASVDSRSVDDISSDFALMAAEMRALATGNPALIEYSQLTSDIYTLEVLERAHWDSMGSLKVERSGVQAEVQTFTEVKASLAAALGRIRDTSAERFSLSMGDLQTRDRDVAGRAVVQSITRAWVKAQLSNDRNTAHPLCELGGFTVTARFTGHSMEIGLAGVRGATRSFTEELWSRTGAGLGVVSRLENLVSDLPAEHGRVAEKLLDRIERVAQIDAMNLDAPYGQSAVLEQKRAEAAALREQLGMPEVETTDDVDVVFEEMVEVDSLPNVSTGVKFNASWLRVGDVINMRGQTKGVFEVLEVAGAGGSYKFLSTDAGDDAEPSDFGGYIHDTFDLISRRASALTDLERSARRLPATDALCPNPGDVNVGEVISLGGTTGQGEREVTGTVLRVESTRKNYMSQKYVFTLETGAGEPVEVTAPVVNPLIIRHNVLDPVLEAQKAAAAAEAEAQRRSLLYVASVLPGDTLLEDVPNLGLRGDVAMTAFREEHWGKGTFHDPKTGQSRKYKEHYEARRVQLMQGREITLDETGLLFGEQVQDTGSIATRIGDLRRGDRVWSTEINPKETIRQEVLVLSIGYGPRHELRYRPVDDPWVEASEAKRLEDQPINVLGRRYGALNDTEFAMLQNPGNTMRTVAGKLDVGMVGSWVEVFGYAKAPGGRSMVHGVPKHLVRGRYVGTEVTKHSEGLRTSEYLAIKIDVEGKEQVVGTYSPSHPVMAFIGTQAPNASDFRGMELTAVSAPSTEMSVDLQPIVEPVASEVVAEAEVVVSATDKVDIAVVEPVISVVGAVASEVVAEPEVVVADEAHSGVVESVVPATLTVEHSNEGTLVSHTVKGSSVATALKNDGFKWSGRLSSWYLPRNWNDATRNARVQGFVQWMRSEEIDFQAQTGGRSDRLHPALLGTGDLVMLSPQSVDLMLINPSALDDEWIPEIAARIIGRKGSALIAQIDAGERQWQVRFNPTEELLEIPSEAAVVDFLDQHSIGPLAQTLDRLIGVPAEQVQAGAVVSLRAHLYTGVGSMSRSLPKDFDGVTVVSTHPEHGPENRLWTVQDRGRQVVLYIPQSVESMAPSAENLVAVHVPGNGVSDPAVDPVPRVFEAPIADLEPGWHIHLVGASSRSANSHPRELVTLTGEFMGVETHPGNRFRVTVVKDDVPEFVVLDAMELEQSVLVEVPVGFVPPEDKPLMEPEVGPGEPGISRIEHRRTMLAAQLLPGAVLVADSGARVAVTKVAKDQAGHMSLTITLAEAPGKTKVLAVPGSKKFLVEPLPLHLGDVAAVNVKDIDPSFSGHQVWWDDASKDAGFVLTFAAPLDEDHVRILVQDGSGSAFRVTLDGRTELMTRSSEIAAMQPTRADAVVDDSVAGIASTQEHGASM